MPVIEISTLDTVDITWSDLTNICTNMSTVRSDTRPSGSTTRQLDVSTMVLHPRQWETHWPNGNDSNIT